MDRIGSYHGRKIISMQILQNVLRKKKNKKKRECNPSRFRCHYSFKTNAAVLRIYSFLQIKTTENTPNL